MKSRLDRFGILFGMIVVVLLSACSPGVDLLAGLETAVKEGTNPRRTLIVESGPYGTLDKQGSLTVVEEIPRQIKATPDAGMIFFHWEIESGEGYLSSTKPLDEADNSFTLVGGDAEIRAVFTDPVQPGVPGIPFLDGPDDTGISSIDGISNQTDLTFKGAWPSGSVKRVELYEGGTTLLGSATTATDGQYMIDVSLVEGQYTVSARAVNQSEELSGPSTGCAITVDTTPPEGTLAAEFYYSRDPYNSFQAEPPEADPGIKSAGWQDYIESPMNTAAVRCTITRGSPDVAQYSLYKDTTVIATGNWISGSETFVTTNPVANRYNPTGIPYRVTLMDVAGNFSAENSITDSIKISYYLKVQHQWTYVDLDGDSDSVGEMFWHGAMMYWYTEKENYDGERPCFWMDDQDYPKLDGIPINIPCDNTYMRRDVTVEYPGGAFKNYVSDYAPQAHHTHVFYFRTRPFRILLGYQMLDCDGDNNFDFSELKLSSNLVGIHPPAPETLNEPGNMVLAHDPDCDADVTGTMHCHLWNNDTP